MIGILPHNDHLDILERRDFEGTENEVLGRVNLNDENSTFFPDSYSTLRNL
jgi:hypothetical protein